MPAFVLGKEKYQSEPHVEHDACIKACLSLNGLVDSFRDRSVFFGIGELNLPKYFDETIQGLGG